MGFIKIIKNKAYYKRYQVKFRRRREGKTDYYARKRLIIQDKNKYATPKYRFVVRFTNRDVICQLTFAKIQGDQVVSAAYSHELKGHGINVGLTNYAAAYATGLLLARRHLSQLKMQDQFVGNTELGKEYHPATLTKEANGGSARRPFKAFLDVGLRRTTTGARLFAAMKGACDGGMNIPHSGKRFIGGSAKNKEEILRNYILGGHVANWMRVLNKRDDGAYQKRFSRYIKAGVDADSLEKTWLNVHASIRKNPIKAAAKPKSANAKPKRFSSKRLTLEERRAGIKARLEARDAAKADA